jgi:hypothetical protein|tara:strand:- start:381 stop:494 length:114 start_codon:yes stop_codon:yes gene_type:complete
MVPPAHIMRLDAVTLPDRIALAMLCLAAEQPEKKKTY